MFAEVDSLMATCISTRIAALNVECYIKSNPFPRIELLKEILFIRLSKFDGCSSLIEIILDCVETISDYCYMDFIELARVVVPTMITLNFGDDIT